MTINTRLPEPSHFEALYPANTRQEEISRLLEHVKSGKSSQLVGLPGSGRSNALGLLSYNRSVREKQLGDNQKWFHFVYMDFSEVKKRNLYDVTKFILISLVYSLSERNMKAEYEKVNTFLKEGLKLQDEMILFQSLKKTIDYLCIEKELTVVLLIDRFEQYLPDVTDQFFLNLKILRNRAKYRFSVIFALGRPLEDILEPTIYAEFYEYIGGNTVYLAPFDPAGTEFRFAYLEKVSGKKASDATKKEIIAACGGLGKLTRLAYEIVLSENISYSSSEVREGRVEKSHGGSSQQDQTIKPDLKTFLLDKQTIRGTLDGIWQNLTPSEQKTLQAIVAPPLPLGEGRGEGTEGVRTDFLENIGLLKDDNITIPLFEEYLKTQTQEPSQNLTYNPEKNEIYKGEESLTEKLSPSEFRMLKYLLQNPDKIIEKEEIIGSVWKDTKTQEGVTDQALDQIIYRLRKKIEEDPNNPVHIQTVKGRGIKYHSE